MKMKVQLIIEDKSGSTATTEIATLERGESDELIGLSLEEAKAITASVQRTLLEAQAREAIDRGSTCTQCKARLRGNGAHRVIYRTAFGRLTLASPRFYLCRCQMRGRQSVSPLAIWLHSHMSPELQYLEAHQRPASHPVLNEFGLPTRNPLRAVGIDGGYVKASDAPSRQEGWFEVMVGKSLPRAGSGQVFAFVHRLEPKTNERMQRFLAEQGVFPAQPTTFLSDGGETVRQAQGEFRDFGEPILDWFHVAMRTTQLTQSIKGLAADPPIEGDSPNRIEELLRELIRAKAYLWHGSPHRALRTLEDLTWEIGTETPRATAMQDKLDEFMNYIVANTAAIPNYADRHRHGEPIATGFVESAVNQVVSKRLLTKQQMRWTMAGAHRLLQVRTRVLNQQLRNDFERWHPQLRAAADPVCLAA